ncbi:alpha-1,2-fucosyltransferase [Hymenobacter tibetensis]|uniref:Alpha-1,2-fucosyltransferase n=1 Tax=Hymenobacter tibetensis TaxID=497967 RepID=A0ABY4D324_9BACT|nr:alpha-1,2-fucosyltransferase [Hymenobacter tibetensis]UOG76938.1 alpha-1,2-fucosyltransferase [Hymenobacter tibetensis]
MHDLTSDYPNLKKSISGHMIDLCMDIKLPQIANKLKLTKYIEFRDIRQNVHYQDTILKHKLVSCDGWFFRSIETVAKYQEFYKWLFMPNVDQQYLDSTYLKKADPREVVVGVHIRRGDYKDHENGRFFFSDEVYLRFLLQLRDILSAHNRPHRFLLFSNDPELDIELYKGQLSCVSMSNNSALADQYLMSKCDYLIGPPSTFSGWANYIGGVPYYHIQDATATIGLDDFISAPYITA